MNSASDSLVSPWKSSDSRLEELGMLFNPCSSPPDLVV